eukprot:snap_masked-scaffold_1-processed-gene-6.13-mRNA-1 protein AED:1.00 eAED:1.00 QI:0/0/0/0/1/1/2/0/469
MKDHNKEEAWTNEQAHYFCCDMLKLLQDSNSFDVSFVIGPKKQIFSAHKLILAARSPVFNHIAFDTNDAQFERLDTEPEAFNLFLKFCYGANISNLLNPGITAEVLLLANEFDIKSLTKHCHGYLKTRLSVENVCEVLSGCKGIYSKTFEGCMRFVEENSSAVLDHPSFKKLPTTVLREICTRENMSASEHELFIAIRQWGISRIRENMDTAPASTRDEQLFILIREFLPLIRFPLMTLKQLQDLKDSGAAFKDIYTLALECNCAMAERTSSTELPQALSANWCLQRGEYDAEGKLFFFNWKISPEYCLINGSQVNSILEKVEESTAFSPALGEKKTLVPCVEYGTNVSEWKDSVVRFKVLIRKQHVDKSGMIIGFVEESKAHDYKKCYGYGGNGFRYPLAKKIRGQQDTEFQEGDVICVKLDLYRKKFVYYKNDKLVFENNKEPPLGRVLYPVVYMYYKGDEVEILDQ